MRAGALLALLLVSASLLAACVTPTDIVARCDADRLVESGTRFLAGRASADGGVAAFAGREPDPRLTAWTLLAAALARRAGFEGLFDARDHVAWLEGELPFMLREGTGVDSMANNVSLSRAALQSWGRSADAVAVVHPVDANVTTLAEAWEARYDGVTGRYGARLNEHLFAGFAARVFEHDAARLAAMAGALAEPDAWALGGTHDPFDGDVWFTAYARALLGPEPADSALAARLDGMLEARQDESGGLRSIAAASAPDASSTAAAILAWGESGVDRNDPRLSAALAFLCDTRQSDGSIPFQADQRILTVKTTAEVVIAVALLIEPIPWPQPPP